MARPIRLALVYSHLITGTWILPAIARRLTELPARSVVLLRRPRIENPAFLESVTATMAEGMGYQIEWYWPDPGGRDQTYNRDFELVAAADQVEAYFPLDHIMEGGTAHVVEAAIMRSIPILAWSIDDHGEVARIGEIEVFSSS